MRLRLLGLAVCSLSVAQLNGCAAGSAFGRPKPPVVTMAESPQPDVNAITPLLQLMSSLPQGDPAHQAELFESAKESAALSPTTSNRLKFSVALATPGHSGADPVAAQRQLAELLARPETLLPVERLLASVALQEVEQRLVLQNENKRLREEIPRDSRDKLLAVNKRLAAESDENVRLRKALDEARAKLEAVTHIERSINDRVTNGTPPP